MAVSIALLKLELLLMRHIYWELDPEQYPSFLVFFFFCVPFLKQANNIIQLKHNSCVVEFSFASFCEVEGGSMPMPLAALRVPELQGGHWASQREDKEKRCACVIQLEVPHYLGSTALSVQHRALMNKLCGKCTEQNSQPLPAQHAMCALRSNHHKLRWNKLFPIGL